MITKNQLKHLCTDDSIFLTQHFILRMKERKISYHDLMTVIQYGDIIEQYPNDHPFPSCLMMGLTEKGEMLHIVCGVSEDTLFIITAYYPSLDKFEEDGKTRKEKLQ